MKQIQRQLEEQAQAAVLQATGRHLVPEIAPCNHSNMGHYQCNQAFKLSKEISSSPRSIAESIRTAWLALPNVHQTIETISIAGAGFINITLSSSFLAQAVENIVRSPRCGIDRVAHPDRVIIEFSSPNIAKELHVGHLRSTIIGDALARLFEFLGHDVLRLNHLGDWGTQFGMLITYMKEVAPDLLTGEKSVDLSTLMQWYKQSKKKFDEDEEFKKRSQQQVVLLQRGDEASLTAWHLICSISTRSYRSIYDLLDIKINDRGESFYNPYLPLVVADLQKKGMVTLSDGAQCIYLDGFTNREGNPLPIIIQKSDGGYNYDTTDMAALRHRIEEERADRIIVVTDAGQTLHFDMLRAAAEKAGYLQGVRFDHVPFGVVLGADGKKFKTRSGETEKLIDLIDEAIERAYHVLENRHLDLPPDELRVAAKILGIDALKYADLASHRIKDYLFSYERMLRLEGNTAPFLLYAYVRIQSIKRYINKPINLHSAIHLAHPAEIALALHLSRLGEVLEVVAEELLPHKLAEYLYNLAEYFHTFFHDCRVEGTEQEESRLLLCEATGKVLWLGLQLLGLKTLDKM